MTPPRIVLGIGLGLALAAAASATDVLLMRNGDRVSGRIVGETSRSIRIETPYGRLLVPRGTIERIQREGRAEEMLNPPRPAPAPRPVRPAASASSSSSSARASGRHGSPRRARGSDAALAR